MGVNISLVLNIKPENLCKAQFVSVQRTKWLRHLWKTFQMCVFERVKKHTHYHSIIVDKKVHIVRP